MNVCMYIYIHIYLHIYIKNVYIYICIYTYIYIDIRVVNPHRGTGESGESERDARGGGHGGRQRN